jgi:hypothetical protein
MDGQGEGIGIRLARGQGLQRPEKGLAMSVAHIGQERDLQVIAR